LRSLMCAIGSHRLSGRLEFSKSFHRDGKTDAVAFAYSLQADRAQ
jgi:hypothetical protein